MSKTIISVFLFLNIQGFAQTPFEIYKTDQSISFDGKIDEALWQDATAFPLIRQSPDYGAEPSEKTDFRMIYNQEFLFVGAKLYSKDPKNIQEFSKLRDGGGPMDWIAFAFDGYNDRQNGLAFATTPAGNRWDGSIQVNGNGINMSSSWNTYWEVKTTRDNQGWYAEFRIPLSSLRFKTVDNETLMNLIIWRKITYNNEFSVFPNVPPNFGGMSFANMAQGHPIKLKGIKSNTPVYLTPYTLAGISNEKLLNIGKTAYENHFSKKLNAGLDLKYSISPQLTLDATVNTDFAQAEVDNFQVNLTRASLFFPEKREFFLERSSNFSFSFEGNNDAFYSRRIGLENDGRLASIFGGARLTGRMKKWDIGLLSMQTEDNSTEASKNLSLIRLKRQINESNSYFGGILTSSLGKNANQFFTFGLDAQYALPQNNFLKLAVAKTEVPDLDFGLTNTKNLRYNARLERIEEKGFHYSISHSIVGDAYTPAMGFEERGNVKIWNIKIGYGYLTKKSKSIFRHLFKLSAYEYDGYISDKKESTNIDFTYLMEFKNGAGFTINPYTKQEVLFTELPLSETTIIPKGSYTFSGLNLNLDSPTGEPIFGSISSNFGQFYGGNISTLNFYGRFDKSRILSFQLNYRFDNVKFNKGIKNLHNQIVSLSSLLTFTTKHSLNSLLQYDKLNNRIGSNIRFRYNAKEGNDFFLVLTNINNTNREREIIPLPNVQSWQAVIKYKHTFAL